MYVVYYKVPEGKGIGWSLRDEVLMEDTTRETGVVGVASGLASRGLLSRLGRALSITLTQ